ncbi:L-threonylcarbamoyladenylate synthase [Palleronia caenipelagi]
MKTERLAPDPAGLDRAADLLRQGRLVAFPTETVYGLGADARNAEAVAAIYAAKGRPSFNPLIVHCADLDQAADLVEMTETARTLAKKFWPGPMTLVLPLRPTAGIAPLVKAGLPTLAVRVPAKEVAQELIARTGCPIAAPSANRSGRISPTRADHVLTSLNGRIDAVLDGGACDVGLESTILAPVPEGTRLLRPGGLTDEDIAAVLGQPVLPAPNASTPTAPGQLSSHYAPAGTVRLNATEPRDGETLLGFGRVEGDLTLSNRGDLIEAAARLFESLQELDRRGADKIAIAPIPDTGIGRAINDRLRRAAAPREDLSA